MINFMSTVFQMVVRSNTLGCRAGYKLSHQCTLTQLLTGQVGLKMSKKDSVRFVGLCLVTLHSSKKAKKGQIWIINFSFLIFLSCPLQGHGDTSLKVQAADQWPAETILCCRCKTRFRCLSFASRDYIPEMFSVCKTDFTLAAALNLSIQLTARW